VGGLAGLNLTDEPRTQRFQGCKVRPALEHSGSAVLVCQRATGHNVLWASLGNIFARAAESEASQAKVVDENGRCALIRLPWSIFVQPPHRDEGAGGRNQEESGQ
jgi:hypothetical protein